MSVTFDFKDTLHRIAAKFVPAFLPGAKKPYYLRAVHQPELDIRDVAGMADKYNIGVSPRVIEEGLTAGLALIRYLVADSYRIKTPLFYLKLRIPGEYEGDEARLPKNVKAQAHLSPAPAFSEYLEKRVTVEIDDKLDTGGIIGNAYDDATGQTEGAATIGGFVTINGYGLKIKADEAHASGAGLFFEDSGGARIRAKVAVNEPLTLRALVPEGLTEGNEYTPVVVTQATAKSGGTLLKDLRVIKADFTMRAQR